MPHTPVYLQRTAYRALAAPSYSRQPRRVVHNYCARFCTVPQMHCSPPRHRDALRLSRSASRLRGPRAAFPVDDFQWFPRFFNLVEQHALLSAALRKLDAAEPRASRKRRRDFLAPNRQQDQPKLTPDVLENAFLPDDLYHFEEVRLLIRTW